MNCWSARMMRVHQGHLGVHRASLRPGLQSRDAIRDVRGLRHHRAGIFAESSPDPSGVHRISPPGVRRDLWRRLWGPRPPELAIFKRLWNVFDFLGKGLCRVDQGRRAGVGVDLGKPRAPLWRQAKSSTSCASWSPRPGSTTPSSISEASPRPTAATAWPRRRD